MTVLYQAPTVSITWRGMTDPLRPPTVSFKSTSWPQWQKQSGRRCALLLQNFLAAATPTHICPTTPQPLQPMFTFMKCNKHRNLFGNGAGKLFLFQLLSLTPRGPYVRVGTTRNPSTDWCGVQVRRISGVVNLVVAWGGKWVIVGEVKGSGAGGFNQIIATMHAVASKQEKWPCGEWS